MRHSEEIKFQDKVYKLYGMTLENNDRILIGPDSLSDIIEAAYNDDQQFSEKEKEYLSDLDDFIYAFMPDSMLELKSREECERYFRENYD